MSKLRSVVLLLVVVTCVCLTTYSPLLAQGKRGKPADSICESGVMKLTLEKAHEACAKVRFRKSYDNPPLVIASECFSKGSWLIVKAQDVTKTGCTIAGLVHNEEDISYEGQAAYIIVPRQ